MSKIYLPYSPGLPWEINKNKIIIRKNYLLNNKFITGDINVVCNGGLLESFFSTFAIEYIKYKYPYKNIIWHGPESHKFIIKNQGIATCSNLIDKKISESYPVPFFKDLDNNSYFNLLDNYFFHKDYLGNIKNKNLSNFIDTFNSNFMLDNLLEYPIKYRVSSNDNDFLNWKSLNKNILNKPYILILPDRLENSLHHLNYVNLTMMEIRGLISILSSHGIQSIVMSEDQSKYYGNIKFIKYSFDRFLELSKNAKVVLSAQPDYSIISLFGSNAHVYSYYSKYMPKIKLKSIIKRIKGRVAPDYSYVKYKNTLSMLSSDIVKRIYGY